MILNSFGAARLLDKNESELVGVTVGDSDHSYNMSSVGSVIESTVGDQYAGRWARELCVSDFTEIRPFAQSVS